MDNTTYFTGLTFLIVDGTEVQDGFAGGHKMSQLRSFFRPN